MNSRRDHSKLDVGVPRNHTKRDRELSTLENGPKTSTLFIFRSEHDRRSPRRIIVCASTWSAFTGVMERRPTGESGCLIIRVTHISHAKYKLFFADLHSNLESKKREISSFAASTAEKSFHFIMLIVVVVCRAKKIVSTTHRTCISPSEEEASRDDNESLNNTVFYLHCRLWASCVWKKERSEKISQFHFDSVHAQN